MKIKQRLAIGHNLSSEDLLFADRIGGLVCPSMAIFRSDILFRNFGEITLLMNKDKVDVKKHPTHNADVFSARFPKCYYKTHPRLLNAFSSHVTARVPEYDRVHSKVDYHEESVLKRGFDEVLNQYIRDPKVLLAFARDHGLNPRIYKGQHKSEIGFIDKMDGMTKFLKQFDFRALSKVEVTHSDYQDLSAKIFELFDKEQYKPTIKTMLRHVYFNDDHDVPVLNLSTFNKLLRFMDKLERDPEPIDHIKTTGRLEKLVETPRQRDRFKEWLSAHIGHAFHTPYMYAETRGGERKKIAFTAENAFKVMKGQVNGTEKTLFMGAGSIRGLVAHRFRSYGDIEQSMQSLVSYDDMDSVGGAFNKRLQSFPDKLAPFYRYDAGAMRYSDDAYAEIAEYAKKGRVSALMSFEGVPDALIKELDTFIADLEFAPTHYFEIKKQRIVTLDEFDVALVPKGVGADVANVLKSHGLKVSFYDPKDELTRIAAVNKQQDLLFGEGEEVTIVRKNNVGSELEP